MQAKRFGVAWLALSIAVGLHVVDETLTGFLSFYNPLVLQLRERLGFWPMPTFEFVTWLSGLIVAVALLLGLSVFAFRGARWMRPLAVILGVLMLLNGLAHAAVSVHFGKLLPGVFTSPLLVLASINLLWQVAALRRATAKGPVEVA